MPSEPLNYATTRSTGGFHSVAPSFVVAFTVAPLAWVTLFLVARDAALRGDPLIDYVAFRFYHYAVFCAFALIAGTSAWAVYRAERRPGFWPLVVIASLNCVGLLLASIGMIGEIRADAFPLDTNWPFP